MRKFISISIIGIALFLLGFTGKLPSPAEGIYSLKLKTLTLYDLDVKELLLYWNFAELTDSKPENLEINGIAEQEFSDLKFGSLRLGNNEKKVWFMMAKGDGGYWDDFYIDQNLDYKITKKERVKSFKTSEGKEGGSTTLEAFSLIPVPLRVSYKGFTKEYEQDLYFFISTIAYIKKDVGDIIVRVIDASFLDGEAKIEIGKDQKAVRFRVIDADSNGCFNGYGKDLISMDLNNDGYYRKNEFRALAEYFYSTGAEKVKRQLRMNLLSFSLKLAVTEDTSEFDFSLLEPEPEKNEVKPAPIETPNQVEQNQPKPAGEGR